MSAPVRFAFTFNTGRQYQPAGHPMAGQVITVEAVLTADDYITVKFKDRSRGLDGGFKAFYDPRLVGKSDERAIKALLMNFYDNNKHVPLDSFEAQEKREAAVLEQTEPTREQLVALWAWQSAMGKQWRSKLLTAWEHAGAGFPAYTPALQQLRNALGPTWLVRFKLPPNTKAEPSRLASMSAPVISGTAIAGDDIEVELPRPRLHPMKINSRTVGVTMSMEDAQALEWLARHFAFEDALRETPPHLGKDVRTERAYNMVHAMARLEEQLRECGARGDGWMYAS